ncbi:four-helix bundle copper-binding protein [Candidatus Methylocalor cossyra]|uniref:Ferredoxin n=1 Tax=Candidatus Methylocalor cossyra TaxID=3108543 RepID=A0ABP1C5I5_9GAMM
MSSLDVSTANEQLQACIQECVDCHRACLETAAYCLEQGGRHAEPDHLRLLFDCAEICQTSANFMLRRSDLYPLICEVCAEICAECADGCDAFEGDARLERCAEACRACAERCQIMAEEEGVE